VGEDLKVKPYEEDDTQGWTGGPGMYHRIHELRKVNKDLKIMLSIGGWVRYLFTIIHTTTTTTTKHL
jgi:GH18 family chitinase